MKKSLCFILSLVFVIVSFSACKNSKSLKNTNEAGVSQAQDLNVKATEAVTEKQDDLAGSSKESERSESKPTQRTKTTAASIKSTTVGKTTTTKKSTTIKSTTKAKNNGLMKCEAILTFDMRYVSLTFLPGEIITKVTITRLDENQESYNTVDDSDMFHWNEDRTQVTGDFSTYLGGGAFQTAVTYCRVTVEGYNLVIDGQQWKEIK